MGSRLSQLKQAKKYREKHPYKNKNKCPICQDWKSKKAKSCRKCIRKYKQMFIMKGDGSNYP